MSLDPRTPVLVGVGVADQRCEDPTEALEPCALMVAALEAAAEDAGCRGLLAGASSIRVPRGFWEYSDPGRLIAERIGAAGARSVFAEIGVLQQTLLNDACRAVAAGEEEIALVTGGDAKYRTLRAKITGVEVSDTPQADARPDVKLEPAEVLWADVEWDRGLMMPAHFFSVMESALRMGEGLGLDAHRDRIASLWAGMSEIAAGNPHAWHRAPVGAEAIRNPSADNPMVAFPYTRMHNSDWNVDQAAGLVLCSLAKARSCGVPEDRWVFPLSGTESNHMLPLAARAEMHRCPGVAIAGERALALAGRAVEEIAHVDLYSCFPAPVEVFARELGLGFDRPLTVTGGMRFAGGPLNNYVLQATARMAEVLRDDPGSTGLVTSLSGILTKQGFGVWSSDPPARAFGYADLTEAVARSTETRSLVSDYEGPAIVAGYTVIYIGADPVKGIAVCDLPNGARTVASSDDPVLAPAMAADEFCGRDVGVGAGGELLARAWA
jgi:acetyl-CoA C-acetyltransferase